MKETVIEAILAIPHADGEKMPSVRELMKSLNVASGTVQKALATLRKRGLLRSFPGKGSFWGTPPQTDNSIEHPFKGKIPWERFLNDFLSGNLLAEGRLPSQKELASRYGISPYVVRKILTKAQQEGLLERKGKKGFQTSRHSPIREAEVLFITRSTPWGAFHPASEREMDFLRFAYRYSAEKKFKLRLLGFDETAERFVDRNGSVRKLSEFSDAVGIILSTLLIDKPFKALNALRQFPHPISIWWEHPTSILDSSFLSKDGWTFFNSSFGKNPGKVVGRHLLKKGFHSAVYFSPYHASSWSQDRLRGLEEIGLNVFSRVDAKFASPWDFRHIASLDGPKFSVEFRARKHEKKVLRKLLKDVPFDIPWVTANDEVAGLLRELEEERAISPMPYTVGFDNSAESYLLRLDSFDCDTENLVRQMFAHLEWGKNDPLPQGVLRQISGKVVEK